jgi:hypothetical protein
MSTAVVTDIVSVAIGIQVGWTHRLAEQVTCSRLCMQIEAEQCEVIVMSDVVYEPVGYTPLLHTLDRIARYISESLHCLKTLPCIRCSVAITTAATHFERCVRLVDAVLGPLPTAVEYQRTSSISPCN